MPRRAFQESYDSYDEGMGNDIPHDESREVEEDRAYDDDVDENGKKIDQNMSGDESTSSGNGSTMGSPFSSCLSLLSKIMFATGSGLHLWLAVTFLGYYRHYEGIPFNVLVADDDTTWMDHYEETNAIPTDVLEANEDTDGEALAEWYASSFWNDRDGTDDYIFQVIVGRDGSKVSQIMAISFGAALSFLLTGMLEGCCLSSSSTRRRTGRPVVYGTMVLAASFGIASACLLEKDKDLSIIFDMVSAHLFFFQAVALLLGCGGGNDYGCGRWSIIAHFFFVLGTAGDVTLSYFYLFEQFEVWHSYMSIGSASSWCLAALIYGMVAISACRTNKPPQTFIGGRRSVTDGSDGPEGDEEEDGDGDDDSSGSSDGDNHGGINAYLKRQSLQQKQAPRQSTALDPPDMNDDTGSVTSMWTAGPGPENKEDIARSSLDAIFGRNTNSTKSDSYD